MGCGALGGVARKRGTPDVVRKDQSGGGGWVECVRADASGAASLS